MLHIQTRHCQTRVCAWQDVAERVAREARHMLFKPTVLPMDAHPMQHLPQQRFVVFVAATTGQVSRAMITACRVPTLVSIA